MKLHEVIYICMEQGTKIINRKNKPSFNMFSCHYSLEEIIADDWEIEQIKKPMKLWVSSIGDLMLRTSIPSVVDCWTEVDLKELLL